MFDEIQFYLFNHHHYIDVPPDEERYESTWVNYPNELSDPEKGHALYQRYTRELLLAEDLGFDAIALNEHHQTAYSMMPAVGIRAAYMAALTRRIKLLVAGPGLRSKVVVREKSAAHVGDTPGVREKERSR